MLSKSCYVSQWVTVIIPVDYAFTIMFQDNFDCREWDILTGVLTRQEDG